MLTGSRSRSFVKNVRASFVVTAVLVVAGCSDRGLETSADLPQPQHLPTTDIVIGGTTFKLMVADEEAERETGLMYRKKLAANEGMIFVFPAEAPRSFYMANTPIDLDIIFINSKGQVVSIKTMFAFDRSPVLSDAPAGYAIEVPAGRAKQLKVEVGQTIHLPEPLRATD